MPDIAHPAWWESRLTKRFNIVLALVAVLIVGRLVFEEDVAWIGWLAAGAAILGLSLIRWPYGALTVLISTSVMARFYVEMGGWKVRPEDVGVGVVTLMVAVALVFKKHEIRLTTLDYWLLAYIFMNYVSSAFGSPEPPATLRWALQHNLAVLPYFLIRLLVQDTRTLRTAFRIFLLVGVGEAIYGIFCYLSYYFFDTTTGVEIGQYLSNVAGPYGSMFEANLFGAYTGCCAVVFLALYLAGDRNRITNLVGFFIASVAMFVSLSRGALLAYVIALWWLYRKARRTGTKGRFKVAPFAVAVIVVILIAGTSVGNVIRERFGNLFQQGANEETAFVRLVVYSVALLDVVKHPILGTGTASFNLTFDWAEYVPNWSGEKTWIGNAPLRILHDTGILGLALFLGFLISIWLKIRRGLRSITPHVSILFALSGGALLYSISFLSTEGTDLAFFWVFMGLLVSAVFFGCGNESANHVAIDQRIV
jgi:O-antigen ligase